MFLISASGKFDLGGNMAENFSRWGIPIIIMVTIGIAEVAGTIMLLFPKLSFYGAVLLTIVMLGSVVTHVRYYDEMGFPLLPVVVIFFLIIVLLDSKRNTSPNKLSHYPTPTCTCAARSCGGGPWRWRCGSSQWVCWGSFGLQCRHSKGSLSGAGWRPCGSALAAHPGMFQ